jgi:hypothetical protein
MAACLAALAAGCGEEEREPIPADHREQLESRLEQAEDRLDNGSVGACDDIIEDTEPAVGSILATIPADVDAEVRRRLDEGFDRLWELVTQECERLRDEQPEPETTPEPLPPPPEETTTETTPTTPEPEPDEGGEGDEGQGNGGGGGGQGNGGGGGGQGKGQGGIDIPGTGGGGTVAPGEG